MTRGVKVRKLREARGMSLCALARMARINRGSLLHIERGERALPPGHAWRLERVLGLRSGELGGALQLALRFTAEIEREDLRPAARSFLRRAEGEAHDVLPPLRVAPGFYILRTESAMAALGL
jgi:transcriptional regulator with XRE-family HTH domain